MIASCPKSPELDGKTLSEIGGDPVEVVVDILRNGGAQAIGSGGAASEQEGADDGSQARALAYGGAQD